MKIFSKFLHDAVFPLKTHYYYYYHQAIVMHMENYKYLLILDLRTKATVSKKCDLSPTGLFITLILSLCI